MSLNSSLDSVADSVIGETFGAPNTDSQQSQEPAGNEPSAAMIGVEPNEPAQESQTPWQLAQGLDPNQVVGTVNGEPVTAAQLQDHIMRKADYTAKTQQVADQRKQHEADLAWMEANRTYLTRLNSQDVNERMATIQEIAKNFGVDLSTPRARDNQGRFTAQQSEDGNLYDLTQITDPDQLAFAQRHNATVMQAREANDRVAKLEQTVKEMVEGVQSAQQQIKTRSEMEQIAQQWEAQGFKGADVEAAMKRIGQPLTAQDALMLANLPKVLAHNANVARGTQTKIPNEAGGLQQRTDMSGAGMSLEAFAQRRLTG